MNPELINLFVKLINISPNATLMNDTFNELETLFETDPAAAEVKVNEIIEQYILTLDPEKQQRARAFNWRIQQDLRSFKDPIARLNKMVEMFWKGVQKFQTALTNPDVLLNQQGEPIAKFPTKQE